MTAADAQTELDLLRAARLRIITGGVAEYSLNGRNVRYLSLADLDAREAVLVTVINNANSSRRAMVGRFRNPL